MKEENKAAEYDELTRKIYNPTEWDNLNRAKRVRLGGGRGRAARTIRRQIERDAKKHGNDALAS